MFEELLSQVEAQEAFEIDNADELRSAVHSLRAAGVTRRGISEMLNIHEQQVRQLLDGPRYYG